MPIYDDIKAKADAYTAHEKAGGILGTFGKSFTREKRNALFMKGLHDIIRENTVAAPCHYLLTLNDNSYDHRTVTYFANKEEMLLATFIVSNIHEFKRPGQAIQNEYIYIKSLPENKKLKIDLPNPVRFEHYWLLPPFAFTDCISAEEENDIDSHSLEEEIISIVDGAYETKENSFYAMQQGYNRKSMVPPLPGFPSPK